MNLVRLTMENAYEYVGNEIVFKSRGILIKKRILGVTDTAVKIDHPDLDNNLQIVSRKIHVLVE